MLFMEETYILGHWWRSCWNKQAAIGGHHTDSNSLQASENIATSPSRSTKKSYQNVSEIHAEWKVLQLSLSDFMKTSVIQKPEGKPLRGWKRRLAGQL